MKLQQERGVMLIQVALTALVLFSLSAFAVDWGAAWYARSQAQTAADAGALAGATALQLDNITWPFPAGGIVEQSAETTALLAGNALYDTSATTTAVASSTCPGYLPSPYNTNCIQVNVYRDGTNGSGLLPTYFANLFGVSTQGVLATATAQVIPVDASGCMRPWFIVDWYDDKNGNQIFDAGDVYPPGYQIPADIGAHVYFHKSGGPSSYGQLDVGSGGNAIRDSIMYCYAGAPIFRIGQDVWAEPGAKHGPEDQGVTALKAWDPYYDPVTNPGGVRWDPVSKTVVGGCAAAGTCNCSPGVCPYNGLQSPRIVQAALCAPTQATCSGIVPGRNQIHIVNILSFLLIDAVNPPGPGSDLEFEAILVSSGSAAAPGSAPGTPGSFITATRLVR